MSTDTATASKLSGESAKADAARARPGWVVVKVESASLCGTDTRTR